MFKRLKILIAYRLLKALYHTEARSFERRLSRVAESQLRILFRILRTNAGTRMGSKYGFGSIRDLREFKRRIPLSTYDNYEPFVEAIAAGERNVLTRDPVLVLEPSSGSTAPSKYVPYTRSLRQECHRAFAPWIYDLIVSYPRIAQGGAYWSVTPVTHETKNSPGGIPVGFADDSEYFGPLSRYLIRQIFTVPEEVSQLRDVSMFRYVTLLFLLRDRNLRFISVWNPSFLTLLLEPLPEWKEALINDIESGTITFSAAVDPGLKRRLKRRVSADPGRARDLRRIFEDYYTEKKGTHFLYRQIWPKLSLISCWADGNAAVCLRELRNLFPGIPVQPKGLIATEAVVSIPLFGQPGGVLAVNSHFFEFLETVPSDIPGGGRQPETKLAHELEAGKRYSVVVTTGGGLYRYHLQDSIEVVGFRKQSPVVIFIGKGDKTVDIRGEKLNERFVGSVLEKVFARYRISPAFFMIAPRFDTELNSFHYVLFLQLRESASVGSDTIQELTAETELLLRSNFHYDYCRTLGQLQPLRTFLISPESQAASEYLRCRNLEGQRLGGIKPALVDKGLHWENVFCGSFIQSGVRTEMKN